MGHAKLSTVILMVGSAALAACTVAPARPPPASPPSPTVAAPSSVSASWDALCPTSGTSDARPIVASEDVELEPSGAALFDGRVAVVGDKQTSLWWWVPGTGALVHDPKWEAAPAARSARSCCASDANTAAWGTPLKRQKARETCEAHRVAAGSDVPWLKGEGLAATRDALFVAGNMGFDCVENEVRALGGAGARTAHVDGIDRARVLEALGASDLRVEALALTPDGNTALLGVRQITTGDPDTGVVTMTRKVVIATRNDARAPLQIRGVADLAFDDAGLGLSDLTILADGRLLASLSIERTVEGTHEVGGVLLVTESKEPWRTLGPAQTWPTRVAARFDAHKPEAVVALSPTCVAVFFDDDEKVKRQRREASANKDPWASNAAFVAYARVR